MGKIIGELVMILFWIILISVNIYGYNYCKRNESGMPILNILGVITCTAAMIKEIKILIGLVI